ncbi:hypothetical protein ACYU3O_001404 [Campylobacter upsaliensis]|nr:hypothetical protein [Campylobacter upsaliensis]
MRRDEFECDDLKLVETMLNSITFGTMIIPDGPSLWCANQLCI